MGTDIHLTVEVRRDDKWVALPSPKPPEGVAREKWNDGSLSPFWGPGFYDDGTEEWNWHHDRNYFLFAILANVRNYGHGVKPISEPRGIPEDAHFYRSQDRYGDHSLSWLSVMEILSYRWDQRFEVSGIIPMKKMAKDRMPFTHATFYDQWGWKVPRDQRKTPESWSGGVGGADIEVVAEHEADNMLANPVLQDPKKTYYVSTYWTNSARERCGRFLQMMTNYVVPAGGMRLVFGFDS